MTLNCCPEPFGADPAQITWNVVRGDTASIVIQFLESNEVDYTDTTDWTYIATAYDQKTDTYHELDTVASEGFVTVTALPATTSQWGTGVKSKVAELSFDLQVTIDDDVVWTPVIGTISVIGDVTEGILS
jgi:hypothetical protein